MREAFHAGSRRGIAALCILCITAAWTARGIRVEYFPPDRHRNIGITFDYPGASPEHIEEEIILPFEEEIGNMAGLEQRAAIIRPGRARFHISMHPSADPAKVVMQIRDALKRVEPQFPSAASRPLVDTGGKEDSPVLILGLSEVRGIDNKALKQPFLSIEGCGRVETAGHDEPDLFIESHEPLMKSTGITLGDILAGISGRNASGMVFPAGGLPVAVQCRPGSPGEYRTIDLGNGLSVGELADVNLRPGKRDTAGRINGEKMTTLILYPESGADITALCAAGIEAAETLPGDNAVVLYNLGARTRENLNRMLVNALIGVGAVILVTLFLLKDFSLALAASLTIPFSILCAAAVLHLSGASLNLVTLSGLAVANGLVMDGSFVIVNVIKTGNREEIGLSALALLVAVLTTVSVFLPLNLAADDLLGRFKDLYLSITWTLVAGYVYTAVFLPSLCRVPGKNACPPGRDFSRPIAVLFRFGTRHRFPILVAGSLAWIAAGTVLVVAPYRDIPLADDGILSVQVEFPAGTSLDDMVSAAAPLEHILRDLPGVKSVTSRYRNEQIRISLAAGPGKSVEDLIPDVKRLGFLVPGGTLHIPDPGDCRDIEVNLYGPDNFRLRTLARELGEKIRQHYPAAGIIYHFKEPAEDRVLTIDPERTSGSGFTPRHIYNTLYWKFREPVGGKAFLDGREQDIRVTRAKDAGPTTAEDYLETTVFYDNRFTKAGEYLSVSKAPSTGTIYRTEGKRAQTFTVRLPAGTKKSEIHSLLTYLDGFVPDEGYALRAGETYLEEQANVRRLIVFGLSGAITAVLIILFYFESPGAAAACLALGLAPGALPVLLHILVFGAPVSTPMILGVLLVCGIQVNNGIILFQGNTLDRETLLHRLTIKAGALLGAAATSTVGLVPLFFLESSTGQFMTALLGTMAGGVLTGTLSLPVLLGALSVQKKTVAVTAR